MKLRHYSIFLTQLLLLISLLLTTTAAIAADADYKAGKAYNVITPKQATLSDSDKIEVLEVFWYGCPHCYRFQPYVKRWLEDNADNISYIRLPAVLNKGWAIHTRAYYTAEALGILEEIHDPLFDAIHKGRRSLNNDETLMAFFEEFGVDNKDFRKTFYSFSVSGKVRQAEELTRRYQVSGTPAVIIDNQYYTSPKHAEGSYEELINIVDFLVTKSSNQDNS
ncbi:MAG: thiol:disulfide interchange protein DsbA/DsbL [Gammaproteobacteria bacterium]|nr:thiol:disulfide interchange protein DsbA/DsbL [Gammaproteobacteria bacterium]